MVAAGSDLGDVRLDAFRHDEEGELERGRIGYLGPPDGPSAACGDAGPFVDPVFDYPHPPDPDVGGDDDRCSITGGYVVRDPSLGDLYGRYVYGDLCIGQIRSLDASAANPAATDRAEPGLAVPPFTLHSFGEDSCGRIYVISGAGPVYRLEGDEPADCAADGPEPEPEPESEPAPAAAAPAPSRAASILPPQARRGPLAPRLRVRVARQQVRTARGARVRIAVRVAPCAGNAGRRILLNRGGRRVAARRLDRRCLARFTQWIVHSATFRALLRPPLAVRVIRSRRLIVHARPARPRRARSRG